MCVTDRYDMTLANKTALNPNTTNQLFTTQSRLYTHLYNKPFEKKL